MIMDDQRNIMYFFGHPLSYSTMALALILVGAGTASLAVASAALPAFDVGVSNIIRADATASEAVPAPTKINAKILQWL
jgi:hypothetical protein